MSDQFSGLSLDAARVLEACDRATIRIARRRDERIEEGIVKLMQPRRFLWNTYTRTREEAETEFKKLGVGGMHIHTDYTLALWSFNRRSGIVEDLRRLARAADPRRGGDGRVFVSSEDLRAISQDLREIAKEREEANEPRGT